MDTTTDRDNTQPTGHKLELGNASTALVEAFASGDAALIRKAASDHATALNSQATAMAASIAAPLFAEIQALKTSIDTKARDERAAAFTQQQITRTWLDDEKERRDTQADNFIKELHALPAIVQEAMASELGKVIPRIEGIEAGMAELAGVVSDQGERLDSFDSRLILVEETPGTSPDLAKKIAYLSTRIAIVGYAVGLLVLVWVLVLIATVLQ